jgi:acetyl-CoA acetyltransferase
LGPGGEPEREDWNMDNFGGNPRVPVAMMETAENAAKEIGITKEDWDALVLGAMSNIRQRSPIIGHSRNATCSPQRSR